MSQLDFGPRKSPSFTLGDMTCLDASRDDASLGRPLLGGKRHPAASSGRQLMRALGFLCALTLAATFAAAVALWATRPQAPSAKLQSLEGQVWDADVLMTQNEQVVIRSFLNGEQSMLEWGSGASTIWFHRLVGEYYSIEHDAGWWNHTRAAIEGLPNVHYQLSSVSPGFRDWGNGWGHTFYAPGNYHQFEDYVHAVDNFNVTTFDRVLVDGRARVACSVYVLRHLHQNSAVFLHNYGAPQNWARERGYSQVLQFYDQIAEIDSLVVLRPKPEYLGAGALRVNISSLYQ
mmetsp:Transcript_7513/g.19282  ORF Transcript_7513/g.19282 Transcript_7513/m.19282 type:complete len:289 (+) Transcript_7513:258-1124(+)